MARHFRTTTLSAGAETLSTDINKRKGTMSSETEVGVVSEKLPELKLNISDDDLVSLTKKWKKVWEDSEVKSQWKTQSDENERYWLGKQFNTLARITSRILVDNVIFEGLETFLPQATRRNPEPLIALHSSEKKEGEDVDPSKEKFVLKMKNRLADLADENVLRLKLKKSARYWSIYLYGVIKVGWDLDRDIPVARVIRPAKMILDPEATIDEDGYTGAYVGEFRRLEASKILNILDNVDDSEEGTKSSKEIINKLVESDEKGTEIQFIEWWTREWLCWTIKDKIILKKKNPHWNYDNEVDEEGETEVNEFGDEIPTVSTRTQEGINHKPIPDIPYIFLSVYNLGKKPMDDTSLIGQNLANQDQINKRNKQIDRNVDNMNGGWIVSGERSGLSGSQIANFVRAMRKGGAVRIPKGSPRDAVEKVQANGLPADVFNDLQDKRNRLHDIFGTRGSTPGTLEKEKTVRGKFLNRSLDTDRIGGGVTEYLEQQADGVYNWFVQLLYVYDDDFTFLPGAVPPKITVSVKEGSLLPKDSSSIAAQAIELATAGKMSTVDLYKRLEYPNAEDLAANAWLEENAPHLLFEGNPLVQKAIAGIQQQQQAEEQKIAQSEQDSNRQEIEKERVKGEIKARSTLPKAPSNLPK